MNNTWSLNIPYFELMIFGWGWVGCLVLWASRFNLDVERLLRFVVKPKVKVLELRLRLEDGGVRGQAWGLCLQFRA